MCSCCVIKVHVKQNIEKKLEMPQEISFLFHYCTMDTRSGFCVSKKVFIVSDAGQSQ